MQVVDPHVHFWNANEVRYPWLDCPTVAYSGDNGLLPRVFEPDDLVKEVRGAVEILKTVDVEANPADSLQEVAWLQAQADRMEGAGHPHGIVAFVDLSKRDAAQQLEGLAAFANVRGVRQILNVHTDARYRYVDREYLQDREWRSNLSRLANYRWSLDLQLYPSQAEAALPVISANPDTYFIVNHTGMFVDRATPQGWRQWRLSLAALAAHSNVAVKISGLAMFDHAWTVESFRPYVLEALEAFGDDRCMFASNFPIDRLHASYTKLWSAYAAIVSDLSEATRRRLFVDNAMRFYRLGTL
jgi:predicted TIM-barrel fold metal-dependent hydrolase